MKIRNISNENDRSMLINTPEKHLLFSLIENALNDFINPQRTAENKTAIFRRAKTWLFQAETKPYEPFSFGWTLECLGTKKELVEVQRAIKKLAMTNEYYIS